ncbi:MAG: putative sulfate/molybdate transporter [Syntrophomonadaceae bacterium]|nr:putative sulfate/molybdate transporter [Syntrophomonadaceae bacterium]
MNNKGKDLEKPEYSLLHEVSGSLGDLGTLLPYVLAVIAVAGLSSASVFMGFGIFYLFSGWFYSMPMAVQPMKAASAAIIVQGASPAEVAAGGIAIGLILLLFGWSGMIGRIARLTPPGVVGGIQLGLGVSLAILGLKMIATQPVLGFSCLLVMLILLFRYSKSPAALIVLAGGTAVSLILSGGVSIEVVNIGWHLPDTVIPSMRDFKKGILMLALPQLPITLTNAVLVTSLITKELYPKSADRASEKNLCLTMGGANLLMAPLGGFMMCHGSGGITAHYRYGGRTAMTVVIIGMLLLLTGVLLGDDAVILLRLIPEAILGALLFYSGIDLAMATRNMDEHQGLFLVLIVAALTIGLNPAVAFIAGIVIYLIERQGWIRLG